MSKKHAFHSVDVPMADARPRRFRSVLVRRLLGKKREPAAMKKKSPEVASPLLVAVGLVGFFVVGVCGGLFVGASAAAQGPTLACNYQMCNRGPENKGPLKCWDDPDRWRFNCVPNPGGTSPCQSRPCKVTPK